MWESWRLERLDSLSSGSEAEIREFLASHGLGFNTASPDLIILARDGDGSLIGTGTLENNIIKQLAVREDYRGSGLFPAIVTALIEEASSRGSYHLFIFTKPTAVAFLTGLGFRLVAGTKTVALLEFGQPDLQAYLSGLRRARRSGRAVGSVVMNCNPFTLGHRHLVETASRECDVVHLFVVSEERSLFPFRVRFSLVNAGTGDLENVVVHEGGPYIISSATFPNYFLRQPGEASRVQAELDATLFGCHIAPALGLNRRYLGEEPLDPTTGIYNRVLAEVLPGYGVELKIIKRIEAIGGPVSASRVRAALKAGDWDLVRALVPPSTFKFLQREALPIIKRLKAAPEGIPH